MIAGVLEVQMRADLARLSKDMSEAKGMVGGAMKSIESAVGAAKSVLASLGVGISFGAVFMRAMQQAKEAEEASKRLDATLKATGQAAGLTKRELDGMADSMAKSTQFDDESIRNAASQLLIFRNIQGDTFKETLKLSADVAAFFGINIPEAAAKLGKSLEDPETAFGLLKRAGVVLTEQQKDQIKTMGDLGDRAGQQRVVLERLQGAFGGMAEEMNTGITKATSGLTKAWNELLEALGKTGPVQMAVQGGLLSLAGALNAVREAHERASRSFAANALAPGINISGKQTPMLPPGITPGAFNDQLNALGTPESLSQEEMRNRSAARLAAEAQRQAQLADARYVAEREAAKKAAKEAIEAAKDRATMLERYRKLDADGWVKYIDEEKRIYEDGLREKEKLTEEFYKQKAILDKADQAAMFAMIDSEGEHAIAVGAIVAGGMSENHKLLEKAAADQKQVWESIESAAYDTFINIHKGGEDVFKRLTNTLQNTLLAALWQMTFKPWIVQIQEQVTSSGGSGGGGGFFGGIINAVVGAFSGGGGAGGGMAQFDGYAEGTDYVPRTGLYQLHQGEKVTPASENRGGGDGHSVIIYQTNNIDSRTDRAQIIQIVEQGGQRTQAQIMDSLNRGGTFAKATGRS